MTDLYIVHSDGSVSYAASWDRDHPELGAFTDPEKRAKAE